MSTIKETVKNKAGLTPEDTDWIHALFGVLSKGKKDGKFLHNKQISAKNAPNKMYQEPQYLIKSDHPYCVLRSIKNENP